MRLVFVAPGVQPPLSEGRKLFITELADLLRQRGVKVEVVTGGDEGSGLRAILRSLRELRVICEKSSSIAAVFVFPFGTYTGIRHHVNRFLVRRAQLICDAASIFVRPVFYSCAGLDLGQLSRRFKPALAVGRSGDGIKSIHLGTLRHMPRWSPVHDGLKTALFLCGYQRATRSELNKVLYERGLIDALKAGDSMASAGISLTVAVPFLRDANMRERLLRIAARWSPSLQLQMVADVGPIELLVKHDTFLFPYRGNHAVFVPTSLLEALQIGIPTLAADQESYRVLTHADAANRCRMHRPCDWRDMVNQLLSMKRQYSNAVALAAETAVFVRSNWTLSRSVDELLSAIPALK